MFAQESVMDIKKLKAEFEKLKYIEEKLEYLNFDERLGCYVEKNNGMPVGLAAWVNGAFYGFNQAAKAQAVPEGFVLVSAEQMSQWGHMANYAEQYGCSECFEARGYAHSLACEINEFFAIEPQEPTND
jgi:hypothetical protein